MLADTVESACRSLENPTEERLEKFIQALINGKIEQKQLNNCELTFHDITKIKETFLQILGGMHIQKTSVKVQLYIHIRLNLTAWHK